MKNKCKLYKLVICANYTHDNIERVKTELEKIFLLPAEFIYKRNSKTGLKIVAYKKHAKRILEFIKPQFHLPLFSKYGAYTIGYNNYIDIPNVQFDMNVPGFGIGVSVLIQNVGYGATKRRRAPAKVSKVDNKQIAKVLEELKCKYVETRS